MGLPESASCTAVGLPEVQTSSPYYNSTVDLTSPYKKNKREGSGDDGVQDLQGQTSSLNYNSTVDLTSPYKKNKREGSG